jgi:RNA 3'-terminal phosphate cyclase
VGAFYKRQTAFVNISLRYRRYVANAVFVNQLASMVEIVEILMKRGSAPAGEGKIRITLLRDSTGTAPTSLNYKK